ncbi:hypothetical protein [Streptomyces geysiriensis]|uniref:hypothetical protein n=1 Tax=Streptomyces geysiriensis TaxID=68207 RepID=UPI001C7D3789|nr:hypothetical protein [Streptomyces geysiriensis]MBX4176515.1 hypothetical protein [Streptomyces geysiriensis]
MRALLDVAGLDGASDAVRLAVLVLASRTPSETGVVEIRTSELGRWIGMSASYTASDVVSGLRRSGVVSVETAEGDYGQDDGLRCKVLPLWAAQDVVGHPLNLAKKEYATLQRLVEAVMAPGWTHRDGRVTPAGLIGTRTGRGAATDRLALLLLVLEARETGRVRQCGGTVDTKRGRAAATVARLLGCTASAGERVLERLEDRRLVLRVRLKTGSGLAHRSRMMVPAVAAAHGRTVVEDVQEGHADALKPEFSDPDDAARPGDTPEVETEPQVSGVMATDVADVAEPDVAVALHTDHPHLVTSVVPPQVSGGFSGEGRGGNRRRPDRARVREDSPLRGEQQKKSPSISEPSSGGPVAGASMRVVDGGSKGRQQRGRVPLPPVDLRAILAPVDLVWARLERPTSRRLVEAAVRSELNQVEGFAGRTDAPKVLADRLARRLSEQLCTGGPINDPVGWLIGRGLPQRQQCGDVRCDDRMLLDSGRDCPRCEDRQADRRAQRYTVAAAVDAAMPGASEAERRAATEQQQLHEHVTARPGRRHVSGSRPAPGRPPPRPAPKPQPRSRPMSSRTSRWPRSCCPRRARPPTSTTIRSWSLRNSPESRSWSGATAPPPTTSWCSTTSTGTASCRRSACSLGRSSPKCSAWPALGTWTSATPPGVRHERRRDVRKGREEEQPRRARGRRE